MDRKTDDFAVRNGHVVGKQLVEIDQMGSKGHRLIGRGDAELVPDLAEKMVLEQVVADLMDDVVIDTLRGLQAPGVDIDATRAVEIGVPLEHAVSVDVVKLSSLADGPTEGFSYPGNEGVDLLGIGGQQATRTILAVNEGWQPVQMRMFSPQPPLFLLAEMVVAGHGVDLKEILLEAGKIGFIGFQIEGMP